MTVYIFGTPVANFHNGHTKMTAAAMHEMIKSINLSVLKKVDFILVFELFILCNITNKVKKGS